MKKFLMLFTLMLVAMMVLAACGGDEAETPTPEQEAEAPTEEPVEEPTEEPVEEPAEEPVEEPAGEVLFFSTQFVPIEEQEKFRAILQEGGFDVTGSEEGPLLDLVLAGAESGSGEIDVVGALHGTFPVLAREDAMANMIDVADDLAADCNIASYAIFPHMTVYDNIEFGLKMTKVEKKESQKRVREAAELLHIEDMLDRYPSKMSGGQRQRVAVARAIAVQSKVLLMDEPLNNLDALLRLEMRAELKRLRQNIKATTIYVTHDQIEALSMGDRIAVMKEGVIYQIAHPSTVYDLPADQFVGSFIGNPPMNFMTGQVQQENREVKVSIGDFKLTPHHSMQPILKPYDGRSIVLGIRAENMETLAEPADDALRVSVLVAEPLGSQILLTVKIGDDIVKVATHPTFQVALDDDVWLRFPPDKIRWVNPDSGKILYA